MDWQRQMLKVIWFVPRLIGKKKNKAKQKQKNLLFIQPGCKTSVSVPWGCSQKISKLEATNHSSGGTSLWPRSLTVGPWRRSFCVCQLLVFYGMDTHHGPSGCCLSEPLLSSCLCSVLHVCLSLLPLGCLPCWSWTSLP